MIVVDVVVVVVVVDVVVDVNGGDGSGEAVKYHLTAGRTILLHYFENLGSSRPIIMNKEPWSGGYGIFLMSMRTSKNMQITSKYLLPGLLILCSQ